MFGVVWTQVIGQTSFRFGSSSKFSSWMLRTDLQRVNFIYDHVNVGRLKTCPIMHVDYLLKPCSVGVQLPS